MKRYMYCFAWKTDRVRTVRVYAFSAREAFAKLSDRGIVPQYIIGVRVKPCTNKEGIKP